MLEDWVCSCNLIVMNVGSKPTFPGPNGESVIDVTLASPNICQKEVNWRVEYDVENFIGRNISFEINDYNKIRFQNRIKAEGN